MDVNLVKDKKGSAWILSHKRCGITECIFLTKAELYDLAVHLKRELNDGER